MLYDAKTTAACPIAKPWGVFKSDERQLMGCHASEAAAKVFLSSVGMSEASVQALIDDAKDGSVDTLPDEVTQ
jgi:hypothetical protein